MRRITLLVAVLLVVAACGDDDSTVTTGASSTTTTAVTTTAPPATTTAPTTTAAPTGFAADDLMDAVLADGDPWVVPIGGVVPIELTIDDIWPLEGALTFPTEHEVYENAGFVAGSFGAFGEPDGSAIVLTGAHLFEDQAGAAAGLTTISQSFNDAELVAAITGLEPGSLTMVFPMPVPGIGDDGSGVMLSGPNAAVIGYVWITDNLLQFVRIGTPLGDEDRAAAAVTLARAIAGRTGG
jgi:hypothetical protein